MIRIKQGETLAFTLYRTDSAGIPVTGEAAMLTSYIRDSRKVKVGEMEISEDAQHPGNYLFYVSAQATKLWPCATLHFDVRREASADDVKFFNHDTILVERGETYDE